MSNTTNRQTRPRVGILVLAAAVVAAGLVAVPSTALAKHNQRDKRGNGRQVTRHEVRGHSNFRVPAKLHERQRQDYRRYYHGRDYFRPHRHYHNVYRFPVYVGGRMVYRNYDYCGSTIFVSGPVVLPRIAFGFNFGRPGGFYFGGYYRD